jgi:PAS domain S-box-containing protein
MRQSRSGQGSGPNPLLPVIMAASIPILLFAGWIAYRAADQQRNSAREVARAAVERVAERISAVITAQVVAAETLALSTALDQPDLAAFYGEARRLAENRPLWHTIELNDLNGSQVLNVLRPLGGSLAPTADRDSFERAVKERRSVVSGIGPVGPISGTRLIALRVPVIRDSELRYILTVALDPHAVSAVLRQAGVPDGWIGAVADGSGNIIARNVAEEWTVGQPGSVALRDAIGHWSGGFYSGRTLEGLEVETVFKTLPNIGNWSVHLGVPSEVLEGPIRRSLYAVIGGVVASLVLASGLGVVVSREITRQRQAQEHRASVALQASEERAALAAEAAELGTWRWDLRAGQVTGSERCRILLGLPRTGAAESQWSAASFLQTIHADDRGRINEAARLCDQTNQPFEMEFRVVDQNGALRWIRAWGRPQDAHAGAARDILGVMADATPQKRAEAERLDLLKRLAAAQEDEQRRIARELHDQVGQTVTGLSLELKGLERAMDSGAGLRDLQQQVHRLQKLSGEIGRDIHRAAADLRPTALDDLGLSRALAAHAADWSKRYGVEVDVQVVGGANRASSELETTVFRIVQEGLTNVLKHACAKHVSVVLEWRPRELRLVIEDDGRGFDPAGEPDASAAGPSSTTRHLGLSGIRERLSLVAGTLRIESAPGVGTSLFVQIPLDLPVNQAGES